MSAGKFNVNLDELGRLSYLAEIARERWGRLLADAAAGNAQAWMADKFNAMFAAQSLDEVEDALFIP